DAASTAPSKEELMEAVRAEAGEAVIQCWICDGVFKPSQSVPGAYRCIGCKAFTFREAKRPRFARLRSAIGRWLPRSRRSRAETPPMAAPSAVLDAAYEQQPVRIVSGER